MLNATTIQKESAKWNNEKLAMWREGAGVLEFEQIRSCKVIIKKKIRILESLKSRDHVHYSEITSLVLSLQMFREY